MKIAEQIPEKQAKEFLGKKYDKIIKQPSGEGLVDIFFEKDEDYFEFKEKFFEQLRESGYMYGASNK